MIPKKGGYGSTTCIFGVWDVSKGKRVLGNSVLEVQRLGSLPRRFNPFMKSYLFLREHPKFETAFPVDKPPPSVRKTTKSLQAPTRSKRPQGRDAAKQANTVDFVVHKVSEAVTKSIASSGPQDSSNHWEVIKKGMDDSNRIMEAMLRQQVQASEHQVMVAAPRPIKKKYFADIAATNQLEAEKKRLKVELEHAELLIAKENAMSKLFELQARHVEETTDFSADFTPDPFDDDGVVEVIGASKTEDTVNEEGIIECSWPVCQGNIHPPENVGPL
jgi:hypothetical protein